MGEIKITIERLEKFIEAEVKIDIIKNALEQEEYISSNELRKILGMEVLKHDIG